MPFTFNDVREAYVQILLHSIFDSFVKQFADCPGREYYTHSFDSDTVSQEILQPITSKLQECGWLVTLESVEGEPLVLTCKPIVSLRRFDGNTIVGHMEWDMDRNVCGFVPEHYPMLIENSLRFGPIHMPRITTV